MGLDKTLRAFVSFHSSLLFGFSSVYYEFTRHVKYLHCLAASKLFNAFCTYIRVHIIGPPSHWSPISLVPHLIGPPSHWFPISLVPQLAPRHHPFHWSPISLVPPTHWSPISLVPHLIGPLLIGPPIHKSPTTLFELIGPPSHWSPFSLVHAFSANPNGPPSHWPPISLVPHLIGPPSHWSPSHWFPNS